MTCSIGFRAPHRTEAGREVLQRLLDEDPPDVDALYRDASQIATSAPGRIPAALQAFAIDAVARLVGDPDALSRALGEWLSEPKPSVCFDGGEAGVAGAAVRLDRRTRMLYDDHHVFINGESFRAGGRDATLMQRLADRRGLQPDEVRRLSKPAARLLDDWVCAGWLHSRQEVTR
jgi:50S ribosomal protein L16 3-hydroxylase